jgi:hypothetical protein
VSGFIFTFTGTNGVFWKKPEAREFVVEAFLMRYARSRCPRNHFAASLGSRPKRQKSRCDIVAHSNIAKRCVSLSSLRFVKSCAGKYYRLRSRSAVLAVCARKRCSGTNSYGCPSCVLQPSAPDTAKSLLKSIFGLGLPQKPHQGLSVQDWENCKCSNGRGGHCRTRTCDLVRVKHAL